MKRMILLTLVGLALTAGTANAALVAYWHFNGEAEAGALDQLTAFGTSGNKLEYAKDSGTGVAELSVWGTADTSEGNLYGSNGGAQPNNFGAIAGTTVNALTGVVAGYSLEISGRQNEGKYFLVELDDGISSCVLTYATMRSATAPTTTNPFTTQTIAYSTTNGVGANAWTNWGTITPQYLSGFQTATVNLGNVFQNTWGHEKNLIRITVSGTSPTGVDIGYNLFDNVQVNGTITHPAPEPATVTLLALGSLLLGFRRK